MEWFGMQMRLALAVCGVVLLGQPLCAQRASEGPAGSDAARPPFARPLDPVFEILDEDHNGELSEAEIRNAAERLRRLDRNRDGELTFEEFMPRFPGGPFPTGAGGPGRSRGGGMGPNRPDIKLTKKHDQDKNGYLDARERAAALAELESAQANQRRRPGGGRRGSNREPARPGAAVASGEVKHYPDHPLYDPNILRTIFIEFEADNWEEEMATLKHTDVEMPATVLVDGHTYPLVGIKFRGQSSFGHVPAGRKRSLNLSMDLVDAEQRLYGYKTLNLLNCNGDASMMSSALYARIAQDWLPVPQANFVQVVINGESWGIYSNVQQFNKDFIKEHYGTTEGARWKVPGSPSADGGLRYLGNDLAEYKARFEIKSKDQEKSWRALVELCRVLNETPTAELPAAIEPILNVDGLLRFLALDVAVVNSDGYWTRASDYSLYLATDGVFHILPHDMNEAFHTRGGRPGGGGPGRGPGGRGAGDRDAGGQPGGPPRAFFDEPLEVRRGRTEINGGEPSRETPRTQELRPQQPQQPQGRRGGGRRGGFGGGRPGGGPGHGDAKLDPLVGLESDRMPLRSKILAVPAYRYKYLKYVRSIAKKNFDLKTIGPVIAEYRELLLAGVKTETRSLTSFEAFVAITDRPVGEEASPGPNLYQFFEERRTFLLDYNEPQERGGTRARGERE